LLGSHDSNRKRKGDWSHAQNNDDFNGHSATESGPAPKIVSCHSIKDRRKSQGE